MIKGIVISTLVVLIAKTGYQLCNNELSISNSRNWINGAPKEYMTEYYFNQHFSKVDPFNLLDYSNSVTYFRNLCNYSPRNYGGSCGYVSFIQYLSYYDSFFYDNIISDVYEYNQGSVNSLMNAREDSPGVYRNNNYPNLTGDALYNYMISNMTYDFQLKLIVNVNQSFDNPTSNYSRSIGMWDYYRIIASLNLSSYASFEYYRVSDFGTNAKPTDTYVIQWFDSYVKSLLLQNQPVMLHIAQYDEVTGDYNNYHSVVAYYFDENGIHANFGYGISSTDCIIGSSHQITEAGVINWTNISQGHSDNFIVHNAKYCGCGYHTEHSYTYFYSLLDSMSHKSYCHCGFNCWISELHVASPNGNFCVYCGATMNGPK